MNILSFKKNELDWMFKIIFFKNVYVMIVRTNK